MGNYPLSLMQRAKFLWKYMGPQWLAYRFAYALRVRTGMLRLKSPPGDWQLQSLESFLKDSSLTDVNTYFDRRIKRSPCFFFSPLSRQEYSPHLATWDEHPNRPQLITTEISQGKFRYFDHLPIQTGFPPDWHRNPLTDQKTPVDRHWSEIANFGHGDIKIIWELSRFGFTYPLVRAYWRTSDERCANLFWQLVESWRERNPPQWGANWKCGQEISFRVMAWIFGMYGFLMAPSTTPERLAALAQMIAVSGERIEAHVDYAISQRNNHGISEGVGLWTIGLLFPEFRKAQAWCLLGHEILEKLGRELIYEDGSFVQHSVNYHRLMLHDYIWALRLGDLNGQPFSRDLKERIARAGNFLYQIQDETSGRVPYYGQNDGAMVLPLSNCDYQDFRPVIQSVHFLCNGYRCYSDGPWDEDLLWLFGPEAPKARVVAPQRTDLKAETGGYYTLRSKDCFAFIRCATFRDRPGQADMLHMDLWWQGQNVAMDAGTYSYNAPEPWNNPFAHTAYHNTVTVDGLDQMDRMSKFLWLPWLNSRMCCHRRSFHLAYWEGEHNGYCRLKSPVLHRRGILYVGDSAWIILDALESTGEHSYRLHWLLPDAPYQWDETEERMVLHTPSGSFYIQTGVVEGRGCHSIVRADEDSPCGWRAPYYTFREPALSKELTYRGKNALLWSFFCDHPSEVILEKEGMNITTEGWRLSMSWGMHSAKRATLLTSTGVDGTMTDHLELE